MDHDAKERAGVARVEDEDQWPCVPPKKGLDAMGKLGAMGGIETFRTSVVPSPALPRFVTTIADTLAQVRALVVTKRKHKRIFCR